jgi:hypothetical protein
MTDGIKCGKPRLVSRTVECVKQGNLSVNFRDSRTRRFVKYKFCVMPFQTRGGFHNGGEK